MSMWQRLARGKAVTRWRPLLLLVAVMVFVAACGEDDTTDPADVGDEPDAEVTEEDDDDDAPEEAPEGPGEPTYPDTGYEDGDTINFVVPFSPGGGLDLQMRIVAPRFEEHLRELTGVNVTVVPQNLPGGAGRIGYEAAANADPDGKFILYSIMDTRIPHDTEADARTYTFLAHLADSPKAIAVHADLELEEHSFEGLVRRAEQEPILFGYAGETAFNLMMAQFEDHGVPFSVDPVALAGAAEIVAAVQRGEVEAVWTTANTLQRAADENPEIEMLVQTGCDRDPTAPDVPTLIDEGNPAGEPICQGDAAPRMFVTAPDTPSDIADALAEALERVIMDEAVREELQTQGVEVDYRGPEESRQIMENLLDIYEQIQDRL